MTLNAEKGADQVRTGIASNRYAPPIGDMVTGQQEQVLLEHLPIVRYLARRIHERLPQHVDLEDLVSAGVVGLMDAFAKFDPEKIFLDSIIVVNKGLRHQAHQLLKLDLIVVLRLL